MLPSEARPPQPSADTAQMLEDLLAAAQGSAETIPAKRAADTAATLGRTITATEVTERVRLYRLAKGFRQA